MNTTPLSGIEAIMSERSHQRLDHGFSRQRDDAYIEHELASAARAYIQAADDHQADTAIDAWPWDPSTFKPSDDPIHNLAKAGALIAAEIDRLIRKRRREVCPICGKDKGQPPERCNGHYDPLIPEE